MATYEIIDGNRYKVDGPLRVLTDKPEVEITADRLTAPADGTTEITVTIQAIGPDSTYTGDVELVLRNTGRTYTVPLTNGSATFRLTSTVIFKPIIGVFNQANSIADLVLEFGELPSTPGSLGTPLSFSKTGNLVEITADATDDAEVAAPLTTDQRDRLLQEAVKGIRRILNEL